MSSSVRATVAILLAIAIGVVPAQLTLAASKSASEPRKTLESESGRSSAPDALLGAAAGVAMTGVVLTVFARPKYKIYNSETEEYETRDVYIDAKPFYWTAGGLIVIAAIAHFSGSDDEAGGGHASLGSRGAITGKGATLIGVGPTITSDSIGLAIEIGF